MILTGLQDLLRYASDTGSPEFLFSAPEGIDYNYDYEIAKEVDIYEKRGGELHFHLRWI